MEWARLKKSELLLLAEDLGLEVPRSTKRQSLMDKIVALKLDEKIVECWEAVERKQNERNLELNLKREEIELKKLEFQLRRDELDQKMSGQEHCGLLMRVGSVQPESLKMSQLTHPFPVNEKVNVTGSGGLEELTLISEAVVTAHKSGDPVALSEMSVVARIAPETSAPTSAETKERSEVPPPEPVIRRECQKQAVKATFTVEPSPLTDPQDLAVLSAQTSSTDRAAKKHACKRRTRFSSDCCSGSAALQKSRQTVVRNPDMAKTKTRLRRSTPHGAYQRATPAHCQVRASEPQERRPANIGTGSSRKNWLKATEHQAQSWKAEAIEHRKVRSARA